MYHISALPCSPSSGRALWLRPLHLERAAAVTSFSLVFPEECKANSSVVLPGFTMVEMFSCPYFQAYRADVSDLATFLALEAAGVPVPDNPGW